MIAMHGEIEPHAPSLFESGSFKYLLAAEAPRYGTINGLFSGMGLQKSRRGPNQSDDWLGPFFFVSGRDKVPVFVPDGSKK